MSDKNAQQQIIDEIKQVDNILVTVSRNPSVDALSAALGFTLMINKLSKHGTAIFSGDIPPAITFLDPQKTFENTVDSLRDFIIALDKEKADHKDAHHVAFDGLGHLLGEDVDDDLWALNIGGKGGQQRKEHKVGDDLYTAFDGEAHLPARELKDVAGAYVGDGGEYDDD